VTKMINTKIKLKKIYNCPSLRTNAKELANEFNKFYNNNNLKIISNTKGATYPIMNGDIIKNDINFKINYSIKKLVKDWLL